MNMNNWVWQTNRSTNWGNKNSFEWNIVFLYYSLEFWKWTELQGKHRPEEEHETIGNTIMYVSAMSALASFIIATAQNI